MSDVALPRPKRPDSSRRGKRRSPSRQKDDGDDVSWVVKVGLWDIMERYGLLRFYLDIIGLCMVMLSYVQIMDGFSDLDGLRSQSIRKMATGIHWRYFRRRGMIHDRTW